MNTTPSVAILGGGYAGMAAAVELAQRAIPVTVFEAAKQLGGRARRVDHRDAALDNGLHILLGAYREALRLIETVSEPGDAEPLLRMPLAWTMHGEIALRAPRLPAPLHLLVALLGARGLGFGERLSALRFLAAQRAGGFVLPDDISVARLLRAHGQPERLCRLLWHPLCIATLNTPVEAASARVFLNVLRDGLMQERAASDMLLPRVDLSALFPDRAARFLAACGGKVLCSRRVESVTRAGDGFEVRAGGDSTRFSHVVCALPPHGVGAVLDAFPELAESRVLIEQLGYQPIASVYLQYPNEVGLPEPMLGLCRRHAQWAFDRGRLAGQHGLIGVVISAASAQREMPQDELAAAVHDELLTALGTLPRPLWQRVITEKRATFSCNVGVRRPPQQTALPNFYLAGDYTASDYPATIESAVASGVRCARLIVGAA